MTATGESFSGGVLAVTGAGGVTLAMLHFAGTCQSGNFHLGADSRGGTLITFRAASAGAQATHAPVHQFVSAMAGLAAPPAATVHAGVDAWRGTAALLAAPRMMSA